MNQISLSLTPRKTVLLRFVLLTAICLLALSASASTTISTDINTEGTLTVTGVGTFLNNVGIGKTLPLYKLDVAGFVNTDQYSGYKQNGNTILYASSTNMSTLVGQSAGNALLSDGTYNTAVGFEALKVATSSTYNTAIGWKALAANTIGARNTASGVGALGFNTTGDRNTATGQVALYNNTIGSDNTANGQGSLFTNTTGSYNTAYGTLSSIMNTTGSRNTAIGYYSLAINSAGSGNVALGYFAGHYETASSTFYVDNQDRLTVTGDRTKALLYGTFASLSADQNLTVNAHLNVTGTSTFIGTSTLAITYTKDPVADVRSFGAKGDGITDDTVAVQAAFNASKNVFFPAGTYIVSGVTVANEGTNISGVGNQSKIQLKSGVTTGTLIDAGSYSTSISYLAIVGAYPDTDFKNQTTALDTVIALKLFSQLNSSISHLTIYGFGYVGIQISDSVRDRVSHLVFEDSTVYNSWTAFLDPGNYAEYIRLSNLDIHNNRYGLNLASGNITATNSKINDNGYGVYLIGTGVSNNGHGNVSNSLINHNTVYSIYTENVTVGFNFIGNNIFDGNIYLATSTGINIADGIIDVSNYYLQAGGKNYIRNNFIYGARTNIINHNYGASTDNTLFVDNYLNNGTFLDSAKTLVATNGTANNYGSTPQINIGTNSVYGSFGFMGYNTTLDYLYLGHSYGGELNKNIVINNAGNVGIGTTTPTANLQVTTSTANATTSVQFGKANQNKGTCMTLYDAAGGPVYAYIAAGASAFTLQNGGTAPSGCQN